MSRRPLEMIGTRSGLLTVIERAGSGPKGQALWLCSCECGRSRIASSTHLRSGFVSSCGCKRNGKRGTPTYRTWTSMKNRCSNPRNGGWANYGGRGIRVCDRWLGENGFNSFLADMGERPSLDHSIDRIDVNGDYMPTNCRWATAAEQGRNTRFTKLSEEAAKAILDLKNAGVPVRQIAQQFGVSRSSIDNVVTGRTWQ